jgi:hypothetical protein
MMVLLRSLPTRSRIPRGRLGKTDAIELTDPVQSLCSARDGALAEQKEMSFVLCHNETVVCCAYVLRTVKAAQFVSR